MIIHEADDAYEIITDDWEDKVLHDVDRHGCSQVTYIHKVDKELIKEYPELAEYKGYWGHSCLTHPYDGIIDGDPFITKMKPVQVTVTEWQEDND